MLRSPGGIPLLVELGCPVVRGEEDSEVHFGMLGSDKSKLGPVRAGESSFALNVSSSVKAKVRGVSCKLSNISRSASAAAAFPNSLRISERKLFVRKWDSSSSEVFGNFMLQPRPVPGLYCLLSF